MSKNYKNQICQKGLFHRKRQGHPPAFKERNKEKGRITSKSVLKIWRNFPALLRILLEAGPDINARGYAGITALINATNKGTEDKIGRYNACIEMLER